MSDAPLEISVQDLKAAQESGSEFVVLDVREPWERDVARLEGTLDIPMNEIPDRLGDLPQDKPIAVLCRSGARSLKVTQFLRMNGFPKVSNVVGGILGWGEAYDPTMARY